MPRLGSHRGTIRSAATVEELLGGEAVRRPFKTADSLSGSRFERIEVGGNAYILKFLCVDDDWLMRATGDLHCRQLGFWRSDDVDRLPDCIDHAVVGVADHAPPGGHRGGALLLRDVGRCLVSTATPVPMTQHRRFLEHMAQLHAGFWEWRDGIGLMPLANHFTVFTPSMAAIESERGGDDPVPALVSEGWTAIAAGSTPSGTLARRLLHDPGPLVTALERTPQTFVHGDWKFGNLGSADDGSTILLDWDRCGRGPACLDLAWYLAVNCDLLPESKEDAILRYRHSLEEQGIATEAWWDAQLALSLLGGFLQLGWAKATGDADELRWWQRRVEEAQRYLPDLA